MKLVIDISEEEYEAVKLHPECFNFAHSILNGTLLPKGHGDLKDISKLHHIRIRGITDYACGYNKRTAEVEQDIADLPTIIEAESEE